MSLNNLRTSLLSMKKFSVPQAAKFLSIYDSRDWVKLSIFNTNRYTRTLVCSGNTFDMYLITWMQGQSSDIHIHHQPRECIFKMLDNELMETIFDTNGCAIGSKKLVKNDISYGDKIHMVQNITSIPSVSLHIYHE